MRTGEGAGARWEVLPALGQRGCGEKFQTFFSPWVRQLKKKSWNFFCCVLLVGLLVLSSAGFMLQLLFCVSWSAPACSWLRATGVLVPSSARDRVTARQVAWPITKIKSVRNGAVNGHRTETACHGTRTNSTQVAERRLTEDEARRKEQHVVETQHNGAEALTHTRPLRADFAHRQSNHPRVQNLCGAPVPAPAAGLTARQARSPPQRRSSRAASPGPQGAGHPPSGPSGCTSAQWAPARA